VRVFDAATGHPKHVLRGHSGEVLALCVARDAASPMMSQSGLLQGSGAGAGVDAPGLLLDEEEGSNMRPGGDGGAGATAPAGPYLLDSSDGGLICSGGSDHTIRIWSARTYLCQRVIADHAGAVLALAVRGRGMLFSASADATVRVFDTSVLAPATLLGSHEDGGADVHAMPAGHAGASMLAPPPPADRIFRRGHWHDGLLSPTTPAQLPPPHVAVHGGGRAPHPGMQPPHGHVHWQLPGAGALHPPPPAAGLHRTTSAGGLAMAGGDGGGGGGGGGAVMFRAGVRPAPIRVPPHAWGADSSHYAGHPVSASAHDLTSMSPGGLSAGGLPTPMPPMPASRQPFFPPVADTFGLDLSQQGLLACLRDLIAIPSVSCNDSGGATEHRDVHACWRAAQYVHDLLLRVGAETRLVQGAPGCNPVVLGRIGGWSSDRPTVCLQATYDVQPAGPAAAWESPPFNLTGRDGSVAAFQGGGSVGGRCLLTTTLSRTAGAHDADSVARCHALPLAR